MKVTQSSGRGKDKKRTPPRAKKTAKRAVSDDKELLTQGKQAVANVPDAPSDKIADLKKQIREGTYQVPSDEIADRIVDEYAATEKE